MQWENLTAADFKKAATTTKVCVIAMGVMEKHGDHLPLGTDFLNGHKLACLAAEKEPAVVWPPFYFGQIYEALYYLPPVFLTANRKKKWDALLETAEHEHACECETSVSLANHPELVRMDRVPKKPAQALQRLKALQPAFTGIRWYSDYPEHYAGDARRATAAKGRQLRHLLVDSLAEFIAAVKKDSVAPTLEREFFQRVKTSAQS